jgi:hypothetical protein
MNLRNNKDDKRLTKTLQRRKRKELSKDRIDKLNLIGFHWSLHELFDRNWEENYQRLYDFILQKGTVVIPAILNGNVNSLYTWLRRQKKLNEENKLPAGKIEKLKALEVI